MSQWPLPELDTLTAPFWEACRRQQLMVQRCPSSGRLLFPPRYRSPWAPQHEPEWVEVSGRGAIWSAAEPYPPLVEPFASIAPYNIVIVTLEEDLEVRMAGNLVTDERGPINGLPLQEITPGLPVKVVFQPLQLENETSDWWLPRWMVDATRGQENQT